MNLKENEAQIFDTFDFSDIADLKTALTTLNEKLDKITRNATFWDMYNITQILLSENDMVAKIAQLNRGESAIVNANLISNGTENYYRGDILYKGLDGKIIHIPAENKGLYKPIITTSGNAVTFSYSYVPGEPTEEDEPEPATVQVTTTQNYYINQVVNSFPVTFSAITYNSSLVKPIIKTYVEITSGVYEEIYLPISWSESGGTITVSYESGTPTFAALNKTVLMRVR